MKATSDHYKSIIFSGCAIEYKGISVCNLQDVLPHGLMTRRPRYEVWSDRHKIYNLYHHVDDAVNKFLELKAKIR